MLLITILMIYSHLMVPIGEFTVVADTATNGIVHVHNQLTGIA